MPVHESIDRQGPYAQWGQHGKRYHFGSTNPTARRDALAAAARQGRAAHAAGYVEGDGFFSDLADKAKNIARAGLNLLKGQTPEVRGDWPPGVRKWLADHGSERIESIMACREPVKSGITQALNAISLGRFGQAVKEEGFDRMYHLWLVIKFSGGETGRLEKNHVVEMYKGSPDCRDGMTVPMTSHPTFAEFMSKGAGQAKIPYDAGNANCQRFAEAMLAANNLLTPALQTFIVQPAEVLIAKQYPYVQKLMRGATDLAAKADVAFHGVGRPTHSTVHDRNERLDWQIEKDKRLREEQERSSAARRRTLAPATWYDPKKGPTHLQSVYFPRRDHWTSQHEHDWLRQHGYRIPRADHRIRGEDRYRQTAPDYERYVEKVLPDGVHLVLGAAPRRS